VAADSGFDTAIGAGITPDFVIGDMDSIANHEAFNTFPKEKIMQHPVDKDFTDTELGAIMIKGQLNCEFILVGGGGGRIDHSMAIWSLLQKTISPLCWITEYDEIFPIRESLSLYDMLERRVSFFPLTSETLACSSKGLKWELTDVKWDHGQFSVSNLGTSPQIGISLESGGLICVLENKKNYLPQCFMNQ
jgi:thiamine pyrophosphokinase